MTIECHCLLFGGKRQRLFNDHVQPFRLQWIHFDCSISKLSPIHETNVHFLGDLLLGAYRIVSRQK